ncbi:MAG: alpha-E domain-containing protein, partial [Limnohabitans sp.]|nr:alpha-E domain-containing protein [Limnohabitans sp.]
VYTGLLALFDSTITFQSQYQQNRSLPSLLALLLEDTDNPRSLAWVAQTLRGRLSKLAGSGAEALDGLARRVPNPATWVANESPTREGLQTELQNCLQAVYALSDAIGARYFTHTRDSEQSLGF